jgi:hypothetical protein
MHECGHIRYLKIAFLYMDRKKAIIYSTYWDWDLGAAHLYMRKCQKNLQIERSGWKAGDRFYCTWWNGRIRLKCPFRPSGWPGWLAAFKKRNRVLVSWTTRPLIFTLFLPGRVSFCHCNCHSCSSTQATWPIDICCYLHNLKCAASLDLSITGPSRYRSMSERTGYFSSDGLCRRNHQLDRR